MPDGPRVARALAEIAALLRLSGAPRFRSRAYEHAAHVVETLGGGLAAAIAEDRLQEIQGIGTALAAQIQQLWHSGTSELLLRLRGTFPEGAGELAQLPAMTAHRVRALHAALGISSVAALSRACEAGRVREVPGFGPKTEARLMSSAHEWLAKAHATPLRPGLILPRALELAASLENQLLEVGSDVQLAGALRRGEELVSEIELVVDGDVARALRQLARDARVLRIDPESATALTTSGVRVQLYPAGPSPGATLLLATGNAAHVAAVRQRAHSRGVRLPPWPLAKAAETAEGAEHPAADAFASEQEVYRALGVSFVPPELRSGAGELEEAAHGDFSDLIELDDIQGMVHCHTTYSDGKSSVLEMAAAAHALGMKYITITDHSPSAHYARGVTLDRLAQQWEEIAAAQEQVPIRILRGTESDILSDGSLDYPDAVLERFEVVIASIHRRHRMDRDSMTARLVRAMALPVFKIWGHGLGRILGHRAPIECDVPAVLDALERSRGAVELNADPHRLDLPPRWIPEARARGLPFVISVDAHSTRGFGTLRYGVLMARRGGVRKAEVLNAKPADAFEALVRPA